VSIGDLVTEENLKYFKDPHPRRNCFLIRELLRLSGRVMTKLMKL
jgi:hypothetical protein